MDKLIEKIKHLFESLFRHEKWCVGIVKAPIHKFLNENFDYEIAWMNEGSSNEFSADPFGVTINDEIVLCYEQFNYAKFKGTIAAATFEENAFKKRGHDILKLPVHASYPYLFQDGSDIYCIPETQAANEIALYRAIKFPDVWEKISTIVDDFAGVDPSIIKYKGKYWLFCTNEQDGKNNKLYIWHSDSLQGVWEKHKNNPVKNDYSSVRSGGTPFIHEGILYRPAQDCSSLYGAAVVINKVIKLTVDEFEEQSCTMVRPQKHSQFSAGLHTLSAVGEYTLIDGKRYIFSPAAFLYKLWNFAIKRTYISMKNILLEKIKRNIQEPKKFVTTLFLRCVAMVMSRDAFSFKQAAWVYGKQPRITLKDLFPGIEKEDITLISAYNRDEHTSITINEISVLSAIVRNSKAENILEIGTYQGNTTLQLAANSLSDAVVTTIDLPENWNMPNGIETPQLFQNITDRNTVGVQYRGSEFEHKIKQIFGDSANLDRKQFTEPFDLIFIDGCHYYDYVKKDSENALNMIKLGGIIVWHDYGMIKDVSRAVDEFSNRLEIHAITGTRLAIGIVKSKV